MSPVIVGAAQVSLCELGAGDTLGVMAKLLTVAPLGIAVAVMVKTCWSLTSLTSTLGVIETEASTYRFTAGPLFGATPLVDTGTSVSPTRTFADAVPVTTPAVVRLNTTEQTPFTVPVVAQLSLTTITPSAGVSATVAFVPSAVGCVRPPNVWLIDTLNV